MKESTNPYSLLLTEEQRIVLKTRKLREDMVDNFIRHNEGLPTKGGEIRVLNEVLDSLDSQVLGLVDKRLKHEETNAVGAVAGNIAEIFKQLDSRVSKSTPIETVEVNDKFIPNDIVPGEDQIEFEEIELTDILKGD